MSQTYTRTTKQVGGGVGTNSKYHNNMYLSILECVTCKCIDLIMKKISIVN